MNRAVVEIKNLVKNFGEGGSETKVLRGMSFEIMAGETVLIFGPSGSGKSTLLNIINGLEKPTSGDVIIDGVNIGLMDDSAKAVFHQQKIGMVFQAYNLIPSLSVLQNITLPMMFARMPKSEREKRAKELLKAFGLSELTNRLPSEISGGQQQRVGIMRALIGNPPIIVADEPTGNLDSVATKNVMKLFSELNDKYNNTLIIVTHDQSLFKYADRIVYILDGSVVKEAAHRSKEKRESATVSVFHRAMAKASVKDRRMLRILDFMMSDAQLDGFSQKELESTISLMDRRRRGEIDGEELYKMLDRPRKRGGVGLYEPTARHIADGLNNILGLTK